MSQDYEPEIEYRVDLIIDGEEVAHISGYSEESVLEDWRKLDHAKDDYFERLEAEAELREEGGE